MDENTSLMGRPAPRHPQRQRNNQQQQQQYVAPPNLTEIHTEERIQRDKHDAIVEIAEDAAQIHECYKTLDAAVREQQHGLDQTEKNIDKAFNKVGKGADELVEARRQQTKARKKMCCIVVFFAVVICVGGIALYISTSGGSKKNN
jgi:hypothetical protein